MDLKTSTEVISNIATSSAIVVGGIWAYFKFIRGRVFARRAELQVAAAIEKGVGAEYLTIAVTLKNTGLSKLPLNNNMKVARVLGLTHDGSHHPSSPGWERIATLPILQHHEWLEAQETVTDTVIYRLGPRDRVEKSHEAYQVEAIVGAPRRIITGKGVRWQSRTVAFSTPSSPAELAAKGSRIAGYLNGINGLAKKISSSREVGQI
jgi:hypothetical protein